MNKEDIFFKNNEVRFENDPDFKVTPELHYTSLTHAFSDYFNTVKHMKKTFHFLFSYSKWDRKSLAFNFTRNEGEIIGSILSFHRFIELHLKYVLKNIHPNLVYKTIDRRQIWNNYTNKENLKEEYIGFREAKGRVHYLLKNDTIIADSNKIIKAYQFLLSESSMKVLVHLTKWRNRIIHNGSTLPNIFAYEYLITQLVIPLINRFLIAEQNLGNETIQIKSKSNLNIPKEIGTIEFDIGEFQNYYMASDQTKRNFLNIFHLKELGRASMNIYFFKTSALIPGPLSKRVEENNSLSMPDKMANLEMNSEISERLDVCNCCGRRTKVTYKDKLPIVFSGEKDYFMWFVCYNCGYYLEDVTLDPWEFHLADHTVFE